jgi:hypothetical protein
MMGDQIRVVLIGGAGLTKGAHCVHFIRRLDCFRAFAEREAHMDLHAVFSLTS